jgi:glycyl-tRNA synthetase beta chain
MLSERRLPLALSAVLPAAAQAFGDRIRFDLAVLREFFAERAITYFVDRGFSRAQVEAALAVEHDRFDRMEPRLEAVRAFAHLPEAGSLAAANKRVGNILKKTEGAVEARVDAGLLKEPAEGALASALQDVAPQADAAFERGDYTASLQALAALKGPVDAFFDDVMVNVEDAALRMNRLGLLATLHRAMNRVADLSKLAA